jgi:hypothetical protein
MNTLATERFNTYISQLQTLLASAEKQKNPGVWLYKNNARTPLFMLQALGKLYSEIQNKKKFTKIRYTAKEVEDAIGQLDYYTVLLADLSKIKKLPTPYLAACKEKYLQAQIQLNKVLTQKGWINANGARLQKIIAKVKEAREIDPKKEVKKLQKALQLIVDDAQNTIADKQRKYTNIETDVHEIRRMLRWISIYATALQGVIQYSTSGVKNDKLKPYLTKNIVSSPFNKLLPKGKNIDLILFNKTEFLALSWLIAELGIIKDTGLRITGLAECIAHANKITNVKAILEAQKILGKTHQTLPQLLAKSKVIITKFANDKVLENLICNATAKKV